MNEFIFGGISNLGDINMVSMVTTHSSLPEKFIYGADIFAVLQRGGPGGIEQRKCCVINCMGFLRERFYYDFVNFNHN